MRLDYKILWIEDDENWQNSITPAIKRHVESKGFNPIIITPNKFSTTDITNNPFKDFDLFLIDYNLKSRFKNNGDYLIEKIREYKIFTNIVFYSSNPEKLNQEIKDHKLNGVYIFERRQLDLDNIDDLYDLIDFFMERDMDTSSLRGIAMSEVAEFDEIVWNIIKSEGMENCKDKLAEVTKAFRLEKYNELKNKDAEKIWEQVDKKGTAVIDSCHMHKFLCEEILKNKKLRCVDEANECSNSYHLKVLKKRNLLAHGRDCMEIDEQIEFRKDLIKFREIFKKLKDELCK